jgi:hypothetical protein
VKVYNLLENLVQTGTAINLGHRMFTSHEEKHYLTASNQKIQHSIDSIAISA